MQRMLIVALLVIQIAACKKPITENPPPAGQDPEMRYTDLGNQPIGFNQFISLDLDKDGQKDISFSTLLVGDPIYKVDKMQWLLSSSFYTNLPVKEERIPVMDTGDSIHIRNFNGYEWFNASHIVLTQKIIGITGDPYWEGDWKQAAHQFAPFQVMHNNSLYNGWVEISFNQADEKLVLHRAAISMEAGKKIAAGK